jgi:UDP-N-acetylmuramate--alanine ligase
MYNPKLHFHFTGIGGSGMSGIAEVLLNLGFKVSGTDIKESAVTERLKSIGCSIKIGHEAKNIPSQASLLVYSSAVTMENPEILEAKARSIPVVRRAEVLAELMRLKFAVGVAGSHGKTTTTSMAGAILSHGGLDPTVIIGGQFQCSKSGGPAGTGSKLGASDYFVAETDESDRSFLLLKPTIAVVTNIDNEHMNAYSSLQDLYDSFFSFVRSVPFYGLAILCIDDPNVRALSERYQGRKLTYGLSPEAQLRAENIDLDASGVSYDLIYRNENIGRARLNIPARHMALNSLAAIAVGLEFGIQVELILEALASFQGVKRRQEVICEYNGITVLSDYGHHPTEVRAVLAAVKESMKAGSAKLHVIFQPHRYSRTKDCFAQFIEAFKDCDSLVLTPIYASSEEPIEGVTSELLLNAIVHSSKSFKVDQKEVFEDLAAKIQTGDKILFLGAGSVGQWAENYKDFLTQN